MVEKWKIFYRLSVWYYIRYLRITSIDSKVQIISKNKKETYRTRVKNRGGEKKKKNGQIDTQGERLNILDMYTIIIVRSRIIPQLKKRSITENFANMIKNHVL